MKLLVSDVWSVYNAGDRAILEGLLDGLRAQYPGAEITVVAHFPDGCAAIEGIRVLPDALAFDEATYVAQLAAVDGADARLDRLKEAFRGADLVVSTGGYFLNATPNNAFTFVFLSRLLHYGWALDAGVPVAVIGQSLGPIESGPLLAATRATFARIPVIGARDAPSLSWLHRTGVAPHARLTADLAVDLVPATDAEIDAVMARLDLPLGALGISVRHYAGTPANAFRDVARAADRVIRELGVPVLLIGTTVPPADAPDVQKRERALGNDDSLALLDVFQRMEEKAYARVCVESLAPRVLKGVLGTCRAFLGTRMHASILASTGGVPTGGIAYEYKVLGWFERMGLQDLVLPLAEVDEARVFALASRLITEGPAIAAQLARAVPMVQDKARDNFRALAALLPPTGGVPSVSASTLRAEIPVAPLPPARVSVTPVAPVVAPSAAAPSAAGLAGDDPRRVWEQESAHYDVLHRRLRRIVDLAEGLGGRRLFDVGCSAGTVGAALSKGWTYHGCDVSEAAVRSARRGWLVPADLERGLPGFDEQPYDVIVCSGILEYLADPAAVLKALTRRLGPDGRLIVSYFNMRHVSRGPGAFRHPLWRNDHTPAEFRAMLTASGWEIEQTAWSTAGFGTAPDVRDEAAAVKNEPPDAAARLDELGHTLIYVARPRETLAVRTPRLAVSVVIPAFNRLDLLRPVLEAFAAHACAAPFEVVVVDDGSDPPVDLRGLGDRFRLHRQENRGRAAAVNAGIDAARGEVVVICDSDIVPAEGFVDDHLRFHRENPAEGATHLGALVWGVDAGVLGEMLGARANPRMIAYTGAIDWTRWYTDNWSFKRALFDRHAFRFDTAFRAWGWEELELAFHLARAGATNTATGTAVGHHLKPVTLDGMVANFARSVPNLLHLARRLGPTSEVRGWLGFRMQSAALLASCEAVLRQAAALVEASWAGAAGLPPATRDAVRIDLSNAIFGLGVEQGFLAAPAEALRGLDLPPVHEAELVLRYADVVGGAIALANAAGDHAGSLALSDAARHAFAAFADGKLADAFESRAAARVRTLPR